jgi:hypothetical protein
MPATGDRITKRKDGLFQGMYTAQTPNGPNGSLLTRGNSRGPMAARRSRHDQTIARRSRSRPARRLLC